MTTAFTDLAARVRRFTGRPDGHDIVLLSDEEQPRLRWSFSEITTDRFRWRGEHSGDGLWVLEDEMIATRIGP